MGNILQATIEIQGVRPLMWHVFGPDALPLEKRERTGVAGHDPEEWKKTVSFTKDGQLYLRPDYFFSSIKEGARYTKRGRGSIQKFVAATLQVEDEMVLVDDRFIPGFDGKLPETDDFPRDPELPVYLDIRGVRNPSTKARNVRYRVTCSTGWTATFHIIWDKTIVSRNEMEAVVIDAGRLAGVGNGRTIGMGRFSIVKFEIEE